MRLGEGSTVLSLGDLAIPMKNAILLLANGLLCGSVGRRIRTAIESDEAAATQLYEMLQLVAFRALFSKLGQSYEAPDSEIEKLRPAYVSPSDVDGALSAGFHRALDLVASEILGSDQPIARSLGAKLEALLELELKVGSGQLVLQPISKSARWRTGTYFTPDSLISLLLDASLEPLLDRAEREAREAGLSAEEAILRLRILDPAVGAGSFLRAAGERLLVRLLNVSKMSSEQAWIAIVRHCLYGVDLSPVAVEMTRFVLDPQSSSASHTDGLAANIVEGDGLLPLEAVERTGGFDLVLGNPPFANAIERPLMVSTRVSKIGGTGDLAFRFLAKAVELAKSEGWVAMVQPRSMLNARSTEAFRHDPGLAPRMLLALDEPDHFSGATVFVALVVLGPPGECRIRAQSGEWRGISLETTNWYIAAKGKSEIRPTPACKISDRFEITAGMTASEAYDCLALIVDDPRATGPKLITTGLIEPASCLWGQARCRYLKQKFTFPRIRATGANCSVRRRLERARRPKVIVAGLGNRVEAFLDARGECVGAVSTYTIFHPSDNLEELATLEKFLCLETTTERYRDELGANALGGGSITMRKDWLKDLPYEPASSRRSA